MMTVKCRDNRLRVLSLVQRYSRSRCVLADIVTCNTIEVCRDLLSESQGEQSIGVSGRYDAAAIRDRSKRGQKYAASTDEPFDIAQSK